MDTALAREIFSPTVTDQRVDGASNVRGGLLQGLVSGKGRSGEEELVQESPRIPGSAVIVKVGDERGRVSNVVQEVAMRKKKRKQTFLVCRHRELPINRGRREHLSGRGMREEQAEQKTKTGTNLPV
jgi:hypothetical protein